MTGLAKRQRLLWPLLNRASRSRIRVMLARLHSVALVGIEAVPCEVEVDVTSRGFSSAAIVGLPDTAVKESLDRIRSALGNCGYSFPRHHVTINLAPADLRKEGPAFDLPMALGLLFANGQGMAERAAEYLVVGELALDGRVRPVRGALSTAMLARDRGLTGAIVPRENANEAGVVDGIDVIPVSSVSEALGFLTDQLPLEPVCVDLDALFAESSAYDIDYSDVRGQEAAKRAFVIAAAGAHNLLLNLPGSETGLTDATGKS